MTAVFKPGDRVRVTDAYVMGVNATSVLIETGSHRIWLDPSKLEPAPTSSPDTPEAGAAGERDALREAVRAEFDGGKCSVCDVLCGDITPDECGAGDPECRRCRWDPRSRDDQADACLPIIDRHTAKAINHAAMAQDTALETALREAGHWKELHEQAWRAADKLGNDHLQAWHRAEAAEATLETALRERDEALEAEREACAKLAEAMPSMVAISPAHCRGLKGSDVAEAIRARASLSPTQEKAP